VSVTLHKVAMDWLTLVAPVKANDDKLATAKVARDAYEQALAADDKSPLLVSGPIGCAKTAMVRFHAPDLVFIECREADDDTIVEQLTNRGDTTVLLHHPRATIVPHLPTANVVVELRDTSDALDAFTTTGMRHIQVPGCPKNTTASVAWQANVKDGNVLSLNDIKTIVNNVMDEDYREQDPTIYQTTANLRAVLLLGQAHANNRRLMQACREGCGTARSSHITSVEREVPRKRRRTNANAKGDTVLGRPMQWCDNLVRCQICKPNGAKRVSRITNKCTDPNHIVRLEGLSKTHDQLYHFAPIAELRISKIDRKLWPEITPYMTTLPETNRDSVCRLGSTQGCEDCRFALQSYQQ
jgi:hypothetical protein